MKAVSIAKPGQFEVVAIDQPVPGPGEVLVRSHTVALSERDLALYQGRLSDELYRYPVIPGHAWAGEISTVGEQVKGFVPGSRVAVENLVYCGICRNCHNGDTNLCEAGYDEFGFTRPGGLAEYVVVPVRLLHVLPASTSLEEAALLESAALVLHSFSRIQLRPGAVVAIVGDDAISLLAVQLAHLFSPAALVVIGLHNQHLDLACQLGATHSIHIGRADPQPLLSSLSDNRGADLVFEGSGNPDASVEAMRLVRRGGGVVLGGNTGDNTMLHIESNIFALKQLIVYGIGSPNSAAWNYAVELFAQGQLNLSSLISHRFPVEEYEGALETLRLDSARKILLIQS